MSGDKVVPIRRGPTPVDPHDDTHGKPPPEGVPQLILDRETGLYDIVVDGVAVISWLDPVGIREKLRLASIRRGDK